MGISSMNRKYLIIKIEEIGKINFEQILQTSKDTLRKSLDGSKCIIKWESEEDPNFILDLDYSEGPYINDEILKILNTPEWIFEMNNLDVSINNQ
jgi:hypothetical protein